MKTERIIWADSLKGLLIILVVIGHAIQFCMPSECEHNHLWNIIYSFHMPAFMAVSGYLNCQNGGGHLTNRKSIIYRRMLQLLIPYIAWSVIRVLLTPPYSLFGFVNIFLHPDGVFWFLWVLFFISIIFYFVDWIAEKVRLKQEFTIIATCLLLAGIMAAIEFRLFGFQFISYYFLFYVVGYFIHKYQSVIITKNPWVISPLLLLWTLMAWFWNMHELPTFLSSIPFPQTLLQYGYRFLTAVLAVYVLFCLSPLVMKGKSRYITWLGKNSLGIYTAHLLLMPMIVQLVSIFEVGLSVTILISFLVALALSSAIVFILKKNRIFARILLGHI